MKISNLRLERGPAAVRAAVDIVWEDCARSPFELFFETDPRDSGGFAAEPEAFLTACILPAMRHGERRVRVDAPLCPRLAEGAKAAVALLRSWYGPPRGSVAIETSRGFRAIRPRRPERAAVFLTGGVDSLHLLQTNRSQYPPDHPDAFLDGLTVSGHIPPSNAGVLSALSPIAEAARLTLVPIRTNLWELEPDVGFLVEESWSSALASAAHLFRGRWSGISLASGRDAARLVRRGTHPLLDPLYSSSALEVRHVGIRYTRFERVTALASWPRAVENLVVCLSSPPAPFVNCGRCEKCLRTMTSLLALGKLSQTRLFPETDVRPERIRALAIEPILADYWTDLLPPLRRQGREDLAGVIEERIQEGRRRERWFADAGWKGQLRRLDRRFLGGRLLTVRRRLF